MAEYIEWIEPFSDGNEPVICRMRVEDVASVQRRREPRYVSDEQAIDDFVVTHWATRKEYAE